MPPIRTVVIAAFVGAIIYFSMVSFMGSFISSNNAAIPTNLRGFYANLSFNTSGVSILSQKANSTVTQLANGNLLSGAASAIGMIVSFVTLLPQIFSGFMSFTALQLAYIGVPTGFALAAAYGLLIAVMVLAVLSAIFIFGV